MPIVVTFDLANARPGELNRIRGAFERLGLGRVGNTAYRFPPLDESEIGEDWLNRVVPALMLLRALARHAESPDRGVIRISLDAQSSTGFDVTEQRGQAVLGGEQIELRTPSRTGELFARQRLRDWLDAIAWPYAEDEGAGP